MPLDSLETYSVRIRKNNTHAKPRIEQPVEGMTKESHYFSKDARLTVSNVDVHALVISVFHLSISAFHP